jgi:hypothetical protein
MNVSLELSVSSWSHERTLESVWAASDIAFDLYVTPCSGAQLLCDNSSISTECVDMELCVSSP